MTGSEVVQASAVTASDLGQGEGGGDFASFGQPPGAACPTCAAGAGALPIYAVGQIEGRFPRAAVEKEYRQAAARGVGRGLTDRETFHAVLSARENRYLARKLCWVLSVQGLETYLLQPRDAADFDVLVSAIRPRPAPTDLDVVIGQRGPLAPPEMCNGLMVPVVIFDQIYSFDRQSLIEAIPRPDGTSAEAFAPLAEELFDRILQMTDNAGATDDHRALNYLAMRYPGIYSTAAERIAADGFLSAIDVRPSSLSGTRRIVECIFSFTHRQTEVTEKFFTRIDVTEEFPFLVTKMSPYYDR